MTHVDTIDQGDPFPIGGTEGRYSVHIRLGFQWDHKPSDDEIRKFNDTAVEATNSLLTMDELKRLRAERLEVLTFLRTVGEDDHRSGALIAARVLVRMNEPRNLT